ncbi:MAG: type VI secretion system tip protein VgrG [Alphaproteobacteria bacterium]|nr:type VI secretion system tip protein VgrG [Alphaproteobacteria bacterium]
MILTKLEGTESISQPFCFDLEMYSFSSNLKVESVLGKTATITMSFKSEKRYISGIIGEFIQETTFGAEGKDKGVTNYRAKLYPEFWVSQFNSDCRIFQNKQTISIIKEVLEEHKVSSVKDSTTSRGKDMREFCVQYNESAFNYVSRLMEAEGIYYFFSFANGRHTLTMGDSIDGHPKVPGSDKNFLYQYGKGLPPFNTVLSCDLQHQVVPKKYSLNDYNFETPKTSLLANSVGKGLGGDVYHYPGGYQKHNAGEGFTKVRIESTEWPEYIVGGKSTVPFFTAGHQFSLKGHKRRDANTTYVLLSVTHKASYDADSESYIYSNEYTAFPAKTPYCPQLATPIPKVYGSQTALVTGKSGEEIWTNKYGQIKVKFHWDRLGKDNETSSCWVRVAQGWAGGKWGMLYTPRIGQEVVVSFLNGDPDRPLVTGSVYNGQDLPPYLPSDPTKSTIKSNTSKGGKGFNEMRFEDKKGKEEYYMHAQKDMNIDIIQDRTTTIEKGNCTTTIKEGSRKTELSAQGSGEGNDTLLLTKGNLKTTLTKGNESKTLTEGNKSLTMTKGNESKTLTEGNKTLTMTKGNQEITMAKGNLTKTLSDGNRTTTIQGNDTSTVSKNYVLTIGGNLSIEVTGTINITAGEDISMEAGGAMDATAGGDMSLAAGGVIEADAGGAINAAAGEGVNVEAAAEITLDAGADISISAAAAVTAEAGADVSISAGAAVTAEAGADVSISSGAAITLETGAACNIAAGAAVSLEAGGIINLASPIVLVE